jgi:AraC-like DNA-binding protein
LGEVQRRFKAAYGQTPKNWLHLYRVTVAARRLVVEPDTSISHILDSCGYGSRSLFYRMFNRYMGCTPNQLREEGHAPDLEGV